MTERAEIETKREMILIDRRVIAATIIGQSACMSAAGRILDGAQSDAKMEAATIRQLIRTSLDLLKHYS